MSDEIGKLLEQSNTSAERAVLLVLYKIQQNLGDMARDFIAHREEFAIHRGEFSTHVTDEQRLLNKGLGAWMVLSVILAVVLSFGGWYVSKHILDRAAAQQIVIDVNSNRITVLETLHNSQHDKDTK